MVYVLILIINNYTHSIDQNCIDNIQYMYLLIVFGRKRVALSSDFWNNDEKMSIIDNVKANVFLIIFRNSLKIELWLILSSFCPEW